MSQFVDDERQAALAALDAEREREYLRAAREATVERVPLQRLPAAELRDRVDELQSVEVAWALARSEGSDPDFAAHIAEHLWGEPGSQLSPVEAHRAMHPMRLLFARYDRDLPPPKQQNAGYQRIKILIEQTIGSRVTGAKPLAAVLRQRVNPSQFDVAKQGVDAVLRDVLTHALGRHRTPRDILDELAIGRAAETAVEPEPEPPLVPAPRAA